MGERSGAMRRPLAALLGVSAILLIAWSLAVPIFEAPDEPAHWTYARFLHDAHRLPDAGVVTQYNYPPLYYLLIAPVAAPTAVPPGAAEGTAMQFPPRFFRNADGDLARYWPIRLARLLSAALSLVTVACAFLAGREATGRATTGLLAGGFVVGLPQFTFRGMNVADDVLVMAMSALATYLVVRLLRRGFTWPVGLAAALAAAAAILAKINGLALVPPLLAALLLAPGAAWRARPRRLLVGLAGVAVLAPWTIRNQLLYGDPLALAAVKAAIPDQYAPHALLSRYMLIDLPLHAGKSFIGNFGWMSLGLPGWLYALYCLGIAAVGIGLLVHLRRCPADRPLAALLLLLFAGSLAIVVEMNRSLGNWQGRYLFPALPALAVLLALGTEALPRWTPRRAAPLVAALALANALILSLIVIPAYWPAP